MRLVFLGPPGAGKGTQARAICTRFGIPQISTGDIIRETVRQDSPLARDLRACLDQGHLVPDALVNQMVEQRLGCADCQPGFLLDGYPRTVAQAETLDRMLAQRGQRLDHVLLLDVPDALLLERVTGRRSDPRTGHVYHVKYAPAPAEITARLIQRSDDTAAVFGKRIEEYRAKTAPLIPYYEGAGVLRRVVGSGAMEEVQERLLAVLSPARA